jgi:hypothetical protein
MPGTGKEAGEQSADATRAEYGHGEFVVRHVSPHSSVGPGAVAASE